MRQALGTAVFFGMLGVTGFGLFLTPVFYVVIMWFKRAPRQAGGVRPPTRAAIKQGTNVLVSIVDANFITAMAGVLGSVSGASAAIATTWISQKSQTIRERAKWETRKRETLYGDFITEASHLVADAFDHSLDKPETLVKLYANLGRIRLVSSDAVLAAAEECCERIIDLYSQPNRTIDQIYATMRSKELEFFKRFSDACRVELRAYSVT